ANTLLPPGLLSWGRVPCLGRGKWPLDGVALRPRRIHDLSVSNDLRVMMRALSVLVIVTVWVLVPLSGCGHRSSEVRPQPMDDVAVAHTSGDRASTAVQVLLDQHG